MAFDAIYHLQIKETSEHCDLGGLSLPLHEANSYMAPLHEANSYMDHQTDIVFNLYFSIN